MSYRMLLKKNDAKYPIPQVGDKFVVVGVYRSTGDLFQPVIDVHLEPLTKAENDQDQKIK